MFNQEERKKWELTEKEFETNMNEVFCQLALCVEKTENPSFIIVGGQAGSGKSLLVARENQDLEGNAIIIDQDELRTKFPHDKYKQIHDNYTEREEFLILKPYISKSIIALNSRAQENGYNIILESALRSVKRFISLIKENKEKGYKTKLSLLAVPEVESNISMLTRYCYYLKKYGECRRNTRLDHSSVQKVKENIQILDELELFDDITVNIRGTNSNLLPKQIFSKSIQSQLTPIQAYEMGQSKSLVDTRRNFYLKYEEIKQLLKEYNEVENLKKLEKIKELYEKETDRGERDE